MIETDVERERFHTIPEVARILRVSDQSVRRWIKAGELRATKPGKEYRIGQSDLEEFLRAREPRPKATTHRSPFEPSLFNGVEDEWRSDERIALAQVLRAYMLKRAEEYDREMRDPKSLHFRTATAATLWLADLYREMRDWCVWVYVNRSELLPPFEEGTNPEFWRAALYAYLSPLMAFQTIRKQAERRIAEMADTPDELAARRLEATRETAEQARRRLESARDVG